MKHVRPETLPERTWAILFAGPTELLGYSNALHTLTLGLMLLAPWWNVASFSPTFAVFLRIAPDWIWGTLLVTLSLATFWTATTHRYRAVTSSLLTALWWALATTGYTSTGGNGVMWSLYFVVGLTSAWVYYRARLGPKSAG